MMGLQNVFPSDMEVVFKRARLLPSRQKKCATTSFFKIDILYVCLWLGVMAQIP